MARLPRMQQAENNMATNLPVDINTAALDELSTPEAVALHKLVDTLSSYGVGEIVDLPQIIVVGEQSAGKSSVLEAISRVRFPVASNVCTRFATEVVLSTAAQTRVTVSVRFDDKSKPTQHFERLGFSEEDLPEIINDAKARMGMATGSGRDFSKDVLRIEVEGPNIFPLKLVDLPGIFHVETADQSNRGRETVNQLVDAYLAKTNSIILVVIEANAQIARHVALGKVKEFDPRRERTLGVITKPDLATRGQEKDHIQLARNQESTHKLKLGWHVLRNKGDQEFGDLNARDEIEAAFFEASPWKAIIQSDRGVACLRKKLSAILYNQIRNCLPGVIDDITRELEKRLDKQDECGVKRSSINEMRSFLFDIATRFKALMSDATNGYYANDFFGNLEEPKNRLRADLRNFHRAFDYIITRYGSKFDIEARVADKAHPEKISLSPTLAKFFLKIQFKYTELPSPTPITRLKLNKMVDDLAASNEGRGLPGSCNSELAIQLFQSLSIPWQKIAHNHIRNVLSTVKPFVELLFRHVVGDENAYPTLEAIMALFVDPFFEERETILYDKVEELLEPFNQGYAVPLDSEFRQLVSRWRAERLAMSLHAMPANKREAFGAKALASYAITAAEEVNHETDGGIFATEQVVDMAQAHYEMSRRIFTDNIMNLAIEKCLVRHLGEILAPREVANMNDKQLREIATESDDMQARRAQLQEEIEMLRGGLAICKRWRPLPELTDVRASVVKSELVQDATGRVKKEPVSLKESAARLGISKVQSPSTKPDSSDSGLGGPAGSSSSISGSGSNTASDSPSVKGTSSTNSSGNAASAAPSESRAK